MGEGPLFTVFMATWLFLWAGIWVLYRKAGAAAKRRWHPWILAGTGAVFEGFVYAMVRDLFPVVIATLAVALVQFLNYKMTKFCSRCGATPTRNPPWTVMRFCSKCGAPLAEHHAV
jgi:hypothetical protein